MASSLLKAALLGIGLLLFGSFPGLLQAGTTGKQAQHAKPSIHCQLEDDGTCNCESPRKKGTGKNRPCIPPDQQTSPYRPRAEPAGCPVDDMSQPSAGDPIPYATYQWQPDPLDNQVRQRGRLLREAEEEQRRQRQAELRSYADRITAYLHQKFQYPQGIHPYNSPYTREVIEGSRVVRITDRYPYLLRTGVKLTVERCDRDAYRVKKIEPDRRMTAAFVFDTNRADPWVPVQFGGSEFFVNNAVRAANSLNTDRRGRELLRFPPSHNGATVDINVVLKNWDSHDLPTAGRQY
jgi:hypothetical protein